MYKNSVPPVLRWARLDSPDLQERVTPASAIESANEAGGNAMRLFLGPTGTGKSSLAAAMARELDGLIWLSGYELYALTREERVPVARSLALVLDDLNATDDEERLYVLEDLLHARRGQLRPTFITTALTRDQISNSFGIAVATFLLRESHVVEFG